jgi:hypothetical protein
MHTQKVSYSVGGYLQIHLGNFHAVVSIVTMLWVGYVRNGNLIPGKARNVSLPQSVHTGNGPHPASYSMDNGDSFPFGKTAEACNYPLMSKEGGGLECVYLQCTYALTACKVTGLP